MADLSGSERPVGTLEELHDNGLSPDKFGSCSMRTRNSKGCAWFQMCRFRQYRDQIGGKKGPVNIGVRVILSPAEGAAADNKIMPCYDWYYTGLSQRQRQGEKTGEIIKVISVEGDGKKIRSRTTVREHPKPEPGCLSCSEGKCYRRKEVVVEEEVFPYPRPGKVYAIHGEAARQREEMMLDEERESNALAMEKQEEMIGGKVRKPA